MMIPIAADLMQRVAVALETDQGLSDVRADCYWQHDPGPGPRQPKLYLVLTIPSGTIGAPPIVGSSPVPLPLGPQEIVTGIVRGFVSAMRAGRRKMLT